MMKQSSRARTTLGMSVTPNQDDAFLPKNHQRHAGMLTCRQNCLLVATINMILRLQRQSVVQAFVQSPVQITGRIHATTSTVNMQTPVSRLPHGLLLFAGTSETPSPVNGEENEQQDLSIESHPPQKLLCLGEVNVLYGQTSSLVYDPVQERYVKRSSLSPTTASSSEDKNQQQQENSRRTRLISFFQHTLLPRLTVAFLPAGGVTSNYYRFTQWRILQRWVSANLHVLGTQSLLLGLGISTTQSQLGAWSAALNWVLKDALGKVVRMFWASRMGQRFDSDAKRWRFRASLVYAAGNGLEIVTAWHPHSFLIWATLANCCKQVSMLTSSSTRTALYNSFRDGTRENIGDITAKGEAQIAIVDLVGIATGVAASRAVGSSIRSVALLYGVLQSMEIVCMYRQLRCVCFRVLNFERLVHIVQQFSRGFLSQQDENASSAAVVETSKPRRSNILSPGMFARRERIFLPPDSLSRRSIAYGSLGRAKLSPTELERLVELFAKEQFLLVVGANVKYPKRGRSGWPWKAKHAGANALKERRARIQENCHIVLHENAKKLDIVKSTLALSFLRQKLAAVAETCDPEKVRSSDCFDMIESSLQQANACFPSLLRQLTQAGWESPARFMFGRVHMRAQWPLEDKIAKRKA